MSITDTDKAHYGEWLIDELKDCGEMPEVRVFRTVCYSEFVDVPADIAIQGQDAIDDYVYKDGRGYRSWETCGDYDVDNGSYRIDAPCGDIWL